MKMAGVAFITRREARGLEAIGPCLECAVGEPIRVVGSGAEVAEASDRPRARRCIETLPPAARSNPQFIPVSQWALDLPSTSHTRC